MKPLIKVALAVLLLSLFSVALLGAMSYEETVTEDGFAITWVYGMPVVSGYDNFKVVGLGFDHCVASRFEMENTVTYALCRHDPYYGNTYRDIATFYINGE